MTDSKNTDSTPTAPEEIADEVIALEEVSPGEENVPSRPEVRAESDAKPSGENPAAGGDVPLRAPTPAGGVGNRPPPLPPVAPRTSGAPRAAPKPPALPPTGAARPPALPPRPPAVPPGVERASKAPLQPVPPRRPESAAPLAGAPSAPTSAPVSIAPVERAPEPAPSSAPAAGASATASSRPAEVISDEEFEALMLDEVSASKPPEARPPSIAPPSSPPLGGGEPFLTLSGVPPIRPSEIPVVPAVPAHPPVVIRPAPSPSPLSLDDDLDAMLNSLEVSDGTGEATPDAVPGAEPIHPSDLGDLSSRAEGAIEPSAPQVAEPSFQELVASELADETPAISLDDNAPAVSEAPEPAAPAVEPAAPAVTPEAAPEPAPVADLPDLDVVLSAPEESPAPGEPAVVTLSSDEPATDSEGVARRSPARAQSPVPAFRLDEDEGGEVPAVQFSSGPEISADGDEPAMEIDAQGGEDSELLIEGGDEEEIVIEAPAPTEPDRGAILAATVTSRKHLTEGIDRLFAADAKAEATARAALLADEADHAPTPQRAAELLCMAADIHDGVLGDHARARELAELAHGLAPGFALAARTLRRIEMADGNFQAALALADEELQDELSASERLELAFLAAELAAPLDPDDATRRWTSLASGSSVHGSLAGLFAGAARRDPARMGEALAALASHTTGALTASIDVARARLMESVEGDSALLAIRDAVRRDASDAGAWLAMTRIGFARSNVAVFRDGLAGLARAGDGGVAAASAEGLRRALDGALSEPVPATALQDAGAIGWLAAHAQRDTGGDPSAQVTFGVEHSVGGEREAWDAWRADVVDAGTETGRYMAFRRAVTQRRDDDASAAAAAFIGGGNVGAVEAALRARPAAVDATEADVLGIGGDASGSVLRAALVSATAGIDAAEAVNVASGESVYHILARLQAQVRAGQYEEARSGFEAIAAEDAPAGAVMFATRAALPLAADPRGALSALRAEARVAHDARRAAGQRLVASALAASADLPGGGDDAVMAAETLPGDLAAAELAAVHALRGEAVADAGADLLEAASLHGEGPVQRMSAVRAALRRASVDADAAAEAIWRVWQKGPSDAALGALVLRTLGRTPERVIAVVRALGDAAHAAGGGAGGAVISTGTLLAMLLERAGRFQEAVQAIARARTQALRDPVLETAEERLWLRAGMFPEAAERAFDQLNAATDDAQRVAAYEKLAELERTYRGDIASSVLSFQAILELAPGHMPSLRTLERYFIEQGRYVDLLGVYRKLIQHTRGERDRVALAHMATRVVAIESESGDIDTQYLELAFGQGGVDRRLLQGLEAEARRVGDVDRFATVSARMAELVTDPYEQACWRCRAAESYASLGRMDAARAHWEGALKAVPTHAPALVHVAREREAQGDLRGAAEALETLGRATRSVEVSVQALFRAALLWRDKVKDNARALAAMREVLAREFRHPHAFTMALDLLREMGDTSGELELLEQRAGAGVEEADKGEMVKMYVRAAEIAEKMGDPQRAWAQWRTVINLDPERESALRALVRLARNANDWTAAADAMIRLAKVTTDSNERIELLFGLGEIFDQHIPDPRRADAAYRRVLAFSPRDARTLQRLAELYARTSEPAKEADMLQSLAAVLAPGAERQGVLLRLARIAQDNLGDLDRAYAALEAARRDSPLDLTILRLLTRVMEKRGDIPPMHAMLDRAATDVRKQAEQDLGETAPLEQLSEILSLRGRRDGARIVAAVAVALGKPAEAIRTLAENGAVRGVGANALDPSALELLAPPAITVSLREMLGRSADLVEQVMPFDPRPLRADKLGSRPHPLRAEIERWAKELRLPSVEIYLGAQVPLVCMPVGRAALLVPASVTATAATRFAVARGLLLMALSLTLPVRLATAEFGVVFAALLRQFEPMHRMEGVDAHAVDELARKLSRVMTRDRQAEIMPFALEVLAHGTTDPEAIRAGALELGDRIALLASGDVAGAIRLLAPEGTSPVEAARTVPAVTRLLKVALRERFMEARLAAGSERPGAIQD